MVVRTLRVFSVVFALVLLWQMPARADGKPFVGVDLGVSEPTNGNYRAHVHTGVTGSPFVGYMFNDNFGVQGQLNFAFQEPDNDHRGVPRENQTTTLLGGTVGPRLSIPLTEGVELYGIGQGGYFTGLSGRLTQSGPGFSVGGGLDFNLSRNIALGLFGRWNRVYMAPRPSDLGETQKADERIGEDIRWATAGISLKYTFTRPEPPPPPPPPPPVAQVAPPPPVKKKIVLRSVNFDFDKATLRADAIPILDEGLEVLQEEGSVSIVVEGHTDSMGTEEYNLGLSRRRAEAVRDYLVEQGIAPARITAEGLGEGYPVASNKTEEGRAQNRRVELDVE